MTKVTKAGSTFTVVSSHLVKDDRLSWKARGVFLYIWSQADGWQYHVTELQRHATDGRDSLNSALHELEQFGYLKRVQTKAGNGKFNSFDWIITDSPEAVEPVPDKPLPENPPLTNINTTSINETTINSNKTHSPADAAPAPWVVVLEYLNEKSERHYRKTDANRRMIEPRLKEGFTVDDCKKAIDHQVATWKDDITMRKYLRPETIFRASKFESYLNNEAKEAKKAYGGYQW